MANSIIAQVVQNSDQMPHQGQESKVTIAQYLNEEFQSLEYSNNRQVRLMNRHWFSSDLGSLSNYIEQVINASYKQQADSNFTIETNSGALGLREEQYFLNKIRNKAAYIKGSLFSNNQFRDEELQINFAVNSVFNSLNVSNLTTDFNKGIVKILNIETQIKRFRNFWPKGMYHCNLDVTIISPPGPRDSRDIKLIFENSQ
jgi:hypothetical protein